MKYLYQLVSIAAGTCYHTSQFHRLNSEAYVGLLYYNCALDGN